MQLDKNGIPLCQTNHTETPTELVILPDLKIGWTLSPCFFHVTSETARGVVESYSHERARTLTEHPFEGSTISELLGLENTSMWGEKRV